MFSSAFVNKDPSKITPADYDNLVKAVSIEIPQNKLLLYSGTGQLLPDNPDTYVHVWQTIYGILGNFPLWCVMKNGKEVFSEGCDSKNPKCRDCSHKPADEYWAAVSAGFAKAASGSVIVLLNGDLGYMDDSYFAKYEVPNLDFSSKGVTALRVLMVNKIDADSCKKANLIKLQEDMKEHKNLYHCRYIMETEFKKLSAVDWWNKAKSG
ncbi:ADP-ribosyl cyclase/cyclic ADP-ribose hydrolase 2-like [Centroberyx affinis]|uniref:ADP-ribosyl cyclase/cyclic ADP-ribose hydrolase 2-like n=1 Tax=Centroberyx affinis TaxID=166261 RepID=UPI003A5C0113